MEKNLKILIENLNGDSETKKLAHEHLKALHIDEGKKEVMLIIDKLYAYNLMIEQPHIYDLQNSVQKAFGEEYSTGFKLDAGPGAPDRDNGTTFKGQALV